jgi:hypothetical protein
MYLIAKITSRPGMVRQRVYWDGSGWSFEKAKIYNDRTECAKDINIADPLRPVPSRYCFTRILQISE